MQYRDHSFQQYHINYTYFKNPNQNRMFCFVRIVAMAKVYFAELIIHIYIQ